VVPIMTRGTVEHAMQLALGHHQAGRRAEAEAIYRQVLAEFPDHAGALHLLGVLAGQEGDTGSAIDLIGRAAALNPGVAQYHSNLGEFCCRAGQWDRAIASLGRAIALKPDLAVAHGNLGNALKATGRTSEAIDAYRRSLELRGDQAAVLTNLGVALHETGRLDDAVATYRQALALDPGLAEASYNLGSSLRLLGRLDEAIDALGQAIALNPGRAEAHNNRGAALHEAGRLDGAIASYRQAIALLPGSAEAHGNLGRALNDAGRFDEAVDALRRALAIQPEDAPAWYQLGNALRQSGRLDEAIAAYQRAIELRPDHALAHNNLGVALQEAERLEPAISAYSRAIAIEPGLAEVHYNLGSTYKLLGRYDEAIAAFRRAIERNPAQAEAYNNLGGALHDIGRFDESHECFRKAALLNPDSPAAASNLLFTAHYHPDLDAQAILAEHRCWARRYAEPLVAEIRPHCNDRSPERRLRVGFVSPDLRQHPVGRSLLSLFLHRDRGQVAFVGYSDVRVPDELTAKLKALSDEWHETRSIADTQFADRIRVDRIDILVDPTLHTSDNRLLVFAHKPAPVQVTMLGPPATTGLATMDYRLTDPYLDPPGETDDDYSEQSVRLPHCFWVFPAPAVSSPVGPLPALRNGFVTFGYLNQFAKVTRPTQELWVKVLQALPGSRLILQAPCGGHRDAVRALFARRGIRGDRLEFVTRAGQAEYFDRYQTLDLSLDPFPYNGHTSSLDPLWMGVPVITLAGRTGVGRGGVSMLTNAGLPELIAWTPEQYVDLAVAWGTDWERLAEVRAGLRQRIRSSPLLDGKQYAADVEAAFRRMWLTWCGS
jgi:predicted O-linked N-acetylglucosamine transferase (SPINDLY family)